jgi:nucleoside-diphosphate-sugar epimerase
MSDRNSKVLLTGATGFLGQRLAQRLVTAGFEVRALVRDLAKAEPLRRLGVEITLGDMGDASSILRAVENRDVVVHAAAGTSGTAQDSEVATIQGTRNVLHACKAWPVKQLVYVSSLSVYDIVVHPEGQTITEDSALEAQPRRRGHYSAAKLEAERLVTHAMASARYRTAVLRLGALYGPGNRPPTGMVGIEIADFAFLVFGDKGAELPLLHVDNAADAIAACVGVEGVGNEVFNVVDSDAVTKGAFMDFLIKHWHPRAIAIYCPLHFLAAVTWIYEKTCALLGFAPRMTVYRLMSSQKPVTYSNARIRRTLHWEPKHNFEQYVRTF